MRRLRLPPSKTIGNISDISDTGVNSMMLRRGSSRFTIMAVGERGCGKSSLFNNLVARPIITTRGQGEIDVYMLNLDGLGASQNIVFIDTPGFGATMDDEMLRTRLSTTSGSSSTCSSRRSRR